MHGAGRCADGDSRRLAPTFFLGVGAVKTTAARFLAFCTLDILEAEASAGRSDGLGPGPGRPAVLSL